MIQKKKEQDFTFSRAGIGTTNSKRKLSPLKQDLAYELLNFRNQLRIRVTWTVDDKPGQGVSCDEDTSHRNPLRGI